MLVDVVMPQLGESVVEGTVVKWLVKPGDAVAKDQPLLELSTDKVDAEIPSPVAGVVGELLAKEGEVVPIKAVIARIETEAGAAAIAPQATASASAATPAPTPFPTGPPPPPAAATVPTTGHWDEEKEGMPSWITRKGEAASAIPPSPEIPSPTSAGVPSGAPAASRPDAAGARLRITPVVARMAAEHALDLSMIPGTGIDGRVTKQDVERYLSGGDAAGPAAATPQAPPAPPVAATLPATPAIPALSPDDQVVPFSPIRKKIAERMVRSKQTSPHVHAVAEVDMHRIMAFRAARKVEGTTLTVLPFLLSAAIRALGEFPALNAWVVGETLVLKKAVHIGVAVETERGLMVPVLRDAQKLSLGQISVAVEELAKRTRDKKITPDELNGGTFSVSNPGIRGNLFGTPIINQPQVGILRMGQVVKRPVVAEVDGADSIVIRPMMYLVLGYDHRVVDGVAGNGFLFRVKEILEAGEFSP
jgi:2-oxoglutarate dehydrogenase E2 component (dihydrolipoamide succinyltransferase)